MFLVSASFSVIYFVGIVSKIRVIEIVDYKEVFFVNLNCNKRIKHSFPRSGEGCNILLPEGLANVNARGKECKFS